MSDEYLESDDAWFHPLGEPEPQVMRHSNSILILAALGVVVALVRFFRNV